FPSLLGRPLLLLLDALLLLGLLVPLDLLRLARLLPLLFRLVGMLLFVGPFDPVASAVDRPVERAAVAVRLCSACLVACRAYPASLSAASRSDPRVGRIRVSSFRQTKRRR